MRWHHKLTMCGNLAVVSEKSVGTARESLLVSLLMKGRFSMAKDMTKDMTTGKPLGLILRFCFPLVCGYMLQQLYSMVDTVIVGRYLGLEALAGVGATGAISFLVIGFATGICTGLSIPMAQAFGAGDMNSMRRYMTNAYYIAAAVTVVLTVLTILGTGQILRWMETPADIYDCAYDYIIVIFSGVGVSILYNLLAAMLRAVGDSKSPLLFLAIASVLNIGLDLLFILIFHMGVSGAGFATVLAQAISGILCLIYLYRRFPMMRPCRQEWTLELRRCRCLISIGLPMALQFSITAVGSIILQTAVNTLGTAAVTSVTAAQKISAIVTGPMEQMGITMATYCGQNLGAKQYERIQRGIRVSLLASLIYCVAVCLLVCFCGRYAAYLFIDSSETEVLALTVHYLRINAVFYPTLGVLFILRNSLQGMGYGLMPMLGGVSELVARALVCFVFVPIYGFMAAAIASPVAWVFADVLLVMVYFWSLRNMRSPSHAKVV